MFGWLFKKKPDQEQTVEDGLAIQSGRDTLMPWQANHIAFEDRLNERKKQNDREKSAGTTASNH